MIDFNNFAGFLEVVGFKHKIDLSKARFLSSLLLPRLPETKMNRVIFFMKNTTKAKKLVKCYLSEYK